jgi:hypothetical protein
MKLPWRNSSRSGARQAVEKRFFVILNDVKDLQPYEKKRFFAALRMTPMETLQFFNNPLEEKDGRPDATPANQWLPAAVARSS